MSKKVKESQPSCPLEQGQSKYLVSSSFGSGLISEWKIVLMSLGGVECRLLVYRYVERERPTHLSAFCLA